MTKHKFKKLNVWQRSMVFVENIYRVCETFPRNEEFGLTTQIKRATISISLNIAEGSASGSDKVFNRHINIALSSAYEVICALEIASRLKFGNRQELSLLTQECDQISAMLAGFKKALKESTKSC